MKFIQLYFAIAERLSKQSSDKINSMNNWTICKLSVDSLTVYSDAFTYSQTRPSFNFLLVPLLSWLTCLTILIISKRQNLKYEE